MIARGIAVIKRSLADAAFIRLQHTPVWEQRMRCAGILRLAYPKGKWCARLVVIFAKSLWTTITAPKPVSAGYE